MTPNDFRRLALALPATEERAHINHPDFRVNGRIFATLGSPNAEFGMVKLSPEQQEAFMRGDETFRPASGAWGRQGSTHVILAKAKETRVKAALGEAWQLAVEAAKRKAKQRS